MGFEGTEYERKRCSEIELENAIGHAVRIDQLQRHEEAQRRMAVEAVNNDKPESSYYNDVKWAFTNWPRFIVKGPEGWTVTSEEELQAQAPSTGAYGLILYAADNLKEFQTLAARVLAKAEQIEGKTEDELKKADTGLDELKRVAAGL